MHDIYANKYGYRYFTVIYSDIKYRAYKVGYYWSNMAEGYILVLYKWLPKQERKQNKHNPPHIKIMMKAGKEPLGDIHKILSLLIQSGYVNLNDII